MSEQSLRVAAVQMVSGTDLYRNLASVKVLIKKAAGQGVQLLVLPEVFALISERDSEALGKKEREYGLLKTFLSEQAKQYGLVIVGGTVPVSVDDQALGTPTSIKSKNYATVYVLGDCGQLLGEYRKIHLFDAVVTDGKGAYKESDSYEPGDSSLIVDTPFGRLGVAVCYDLRFPEMFRYMAKQGMDILAVPAAFTKVTGLAHWQTLLKSRAIESQCVVIGANQGGDHDNGRETSGQSSIVDHWGRILAECEFGEQLVIADIDLSEQEKCRTNMPVLSHTRFGIEVPS
jgi:nitrilase